MLTDLLLLLGAAILGALGLGAYGEMQRRRGEQEAEDDAMQDAYEREARGRDALRDGRASGADPDERVRNNDSRW